MIEKVKAAGFDMIDLAEEWEYNRGVIDAIDMVIKMMEEEKEKKEEKIRETLDKYVEKIEVRPDAKKEEPEEKERKTKVDVGKIRALAAAGWKIADIAAEVHCSEQTVRNHLK